MADKGAPIGNDNAHRGKLWNDALRKAIVQDKGERVRVAVGKLLAKAAKGEPWAIKELADRLDGKAAQAIVGADGGDLKVIQRIERVIIDPHAKD